MFGDGDNRPVVKGNTASKQHIEPVHGMELSFSIIQLREVCRYVLAYHL